MASPRVRRCAVQLTPDEMAYVTRAWSAGVSNGEIASAIGMPASKFAECRTCGVLRHLPRRQGSRCDRRDELVQLGDAPDPTEQEIAERAAEVRLLWSPQQQAARAGLPPLDGAHQADGPRRIVSIADITAAWDAAE